MKAMKSEDAPPITRLPLEILEALVECSSPSSQLAVAQVSKLFHSLSLRSLYRSISLTEKRRLMGCCNTLGKNPSAASKVRSFTVQYQLNSYRSYLLSSYYSNIQNALSSLSHLHTLRLLVADVRFADLLRPCFFPSLRRFECALTISAPLAIFINRHPHLLHLQLSPSEDSDSEGQLPDIPQLDLPRLLSFSGNFQSVPALRSTSALRAALIQWHAYDTPLAPIIEALHSCSHGGLSLLSCRRRGWNDDLLEVVSTHLPDILSLHLSNVLLVDTPTTEGYVTRVNGLLSRFTQLQRLRIICIDYWEMGSVSADLDFDFAAVSRWGKACSSLVEITLPHAQELAWYRISDDVWIPDPTSPLGTTWLSDAIVMRRHLKLTLFINKLRFRDRADQPEAGSASGGIGPIEYIETIAAVRRKFFDLLKSRYPDVISTEPSPTPGAQISEPTRC